MKSPEQIAADLVSKFSWSSNRILNGRLVGEQYFVAQAVADAVRAERREIERLRQELHRIQCEQLDRATNTKRSAKTLRNMAMATRDRIICILGQS